MLAVVVGAVCGGGGCLLLLILVLLKYKLMKRKTKPQKYYTQIELDENIVYMKDRWLVGCFGFNGPLIWLVGCFGFNGPLRQYFSLYRAISQREGERGEKRIDEKKCPNNPHPHLLQAQ